MVIKELQTRIALKYDSYDAWTKGPGKDLILLKGEIGICEILSDDIATTAPTVLYKIGDGKSTFENLKWASALAADVYSWAKAETVVLEDNTLKFKTGESTVHTVNLSSFATDSEVTAITSRLEARITALESTSGGDVITNEQFNTLDQRLDILEGDVTTAGSVANAIKVANTYTDAIETSLSAEITSKTSQLSAKQENLESEVATIDAAIQVETYNREQADNDITSKIGSGFDETNTVKKAIESAAALGQQGINAAANVQTSLTALTSGTISQHAASIEQLNSELESLTAAVETNNSNLASRLEGIEAFFEAADHDGKDGGLKDALDTLVEIQDYLIGEGSATGGLISRLVVAENNIDSLEATLSKGGDFEKRVASAEASISANGAEINSIQKLVAGYSGEGAVKAAIDKAQADATQGIADAAAVKTTAESALVIANQANNQISTFGTLLSAVQATAEGAEAGVANASSRLTIMESAVTNIQAVVISGDNSNEKLRADITSLQGLTSDTTTLRSDISELQSVVSLQATSISDARSIADSAISKAEKALAEAENIKSDYLTSEDEFIFKCGTSTTTVY